MILRRVELQNFGRFNDSVFEFRRGLNLVSGPSESGKTTLAEAVPLVLFGAREGERFKTWGSKKGCSAALEFEAADRTLRVERDLLADHVSLTVKDAAGFELQRFAGRVPLLEETADSAPYRQALQQMFGFADEQQFRFGQLFGQGNVNRLVAQGMAKFSANGSSNSPVGDGEDELQAVRQRLAELERLWFATREGLAETSALQERIAELEASLEADRTVSSCEESSSGLSPRPLHGCSSPSVPGAESQGQPAVSDAGLEARRQALERDIARTGLPREMPADLPGILVQADEIRQEMIAIQKEAAGLRQQLLKRPNPSCRPALAMTLLFAVLGGGLIWVRPGWLLAGGSLGALTTLLFWALYLWRMAQESSERGRLKVPLQKLEERREEAQSRLAGLDESFFRIGLSPSAVEIVRMQKNLERHLLLQQELAEIERALQLSEPVGGGCRAAAAPEGMALYERDQSSPVVPTREEIADRSHGRPAPVGLQSAATGEGLRDREGELEDLTRQLASQQKLRDALRRIEQEGESLRRLEAELLGRSRYSRQDGPPSAGAGSAPGIDLAQLEADAGQLLSAMTAGRYGAVRLEADGTAALRAGDGQWHPLDHFSRGTVDSTCFALRLALGRHFSGERRLPLLLDDCLTGLDRERLSESVKLLERLAGEQQVILITRDESLRKKAGRERWHTISLAPAREPKHSRPQERNDDDGQLHLL